ncbi:MAG: inositol monophosphatase [Bacteriovoracaceae bacterium]|nr:inositol monophosphatase [Bacteriovoracaceae bacterium]
MKTSKELNWVIDLAEQSGEILLKYSSQIESLERHHKAGQGFATQADEESERFLIKEISKVYPTDQFLAEESFFKSGKKEYSECKNGRVWFIDPLDGTNNFVNGIPYYSVCIGLVEDSVVKLGVVYNPFTGDCYFAEKGKGAYYENKLREIPMRKISKAKNLTKMSESMVSLGIISSRKLDVKSDYQKLVTMMKIIRAARKFGSAALDMCMVASGQLDAYIETSLKPWDVAAASLILTESEVIITDLDCLDYNVFKPGVFAAREPLYSEIKNFLLAEK